LLSRRPTAHTSAPTEVLTEVGTDQPATAELAAPSGASRRRPPAGLRRPAFLLAVAVAGGVMVNVFAAGQPDAAAVAGADEPISVAAQLQESSQDSAADASSTTEDVSERLGELAASRSEREAQQSAAAQSQAAADQAAIEARAAAEAKAAAEAQAAAEAKAAAEAQAAAEA
jgi:hypothetical protein